MNSELFLIFIVIIFIAFFILCIIGHAVYLEELKEKNKLVLKHDTKLDFLTQLKSKIEPEDINDKNTKHVAKAISKLNREKHDISYYNIYDLFSGKDKKKRINGGLYKILSQNINKWDIDSDKNTAFSEWESGLLNIEI